MEKILKYSVIAIVGVFTLALVIQLITGLSYRGYPYPYGYTNAPYGMGSWMMGYGYGYGYGGPGWIEFEPRTAYGPGVGMMGGFGCPMCGSQGPGWGYGRYSNYPQAITIDEAIKIAENYLSTSSYSDLKVDEVYEFTNHFEVEFEEKSTGIHAFEILINKFSGAISPEMGPNVMWNTKYGHMYYAPSAKMSVTSEQASEIAKNWLASYDANLTLSEGPEVYYGFYEFHVKQDGRTVAQINVNGFSGQVWFENWHGTLLAEKEV
jgi:hypothetical protein